MFSDVHILISIGYSEVRVYLIRVCGTESTYLGRYATVVKIRFMTHYILDKTILIYFDVF